MQVLKDNKNTILLIIFFFFLTSYQIKKINIFTFFRVNEVEFIGSKNFEENLKDDLTNNLNNKNSLTKILQNEIKVGKIDFKISDSRNPIQEISYVINCRNVFVSKFIEKKRQLNMNCQEQNKLEFSVNGNLEEDTNSFTGKFVNLKLEKLLNKKFIEYTNLNSKKISTNLNGNYKIRTNKTTSSCN